MPSDRLLRRLWALEAETAPNTIIVIGDEPEPPPERGVRIMRIETGVPRSKHWRTYDAPAAISH